MANSLQPNMLLVRQDSFEKAHNFRSSPVAINAIWLNVQRSELNGTLSDSWSWRRSIFVQKKTVELCSWILIFCRICYLVHLDHLHHLDQGTAETVKTFSKSRCIEVLQFSTQLKFFKVAAIVVPGASCRWETAFNFSLPGTFLFWELGLLQFEYLWVQQVTV